MSLYENAFSRFELLKRPMRIFSNILDCFVSGERAGKPFKLKFESSTICNLKCVMCPLTHNLKREKGVLKFENFKKVFDEIKPPYINLTGLGEPLLNKDIFRIIRYARRKNSYVKLDTNATLLTDERIEKLISSDPTFVSVSLDGASKKTYESIRKGANFEQVINNLKKMIKYRNESESKTKIHVFFVLQNKNLDELIEIIKLCNEIGIDALNGTVVISFGNAKNKKLRKIPLEKIEKLRQRLEKIKREITIQLNIESIEQFLEDPLNFEKENSKKPCYYIWYNPYITWDGNVLPCDLHADNEIVFGNAFREPFMKIWNNKKARNFRRQIIKKRTGICEKCGVDESFILNKYNLFYKLPTKIFSKRKIR